MNRQNRIEKALNEAIEPDSLIVENISHQHAGHSGDDGTGETHYSVYIRSTKFKNLSKIQQHQKVYAALRAELDNGLHALELNTTIN